VVDKTIRVAGRTRFPPTSTDMTRTLWAVLLASLVGGSAVAEDPVTLTIRRPAKGDVVKETKTEDATATVEVKKGEQKGMKQVPSTSRAVYTETVDDKKEADKKPSKLTRKYETWEVSREGKKVDLGLDGKTVVIAKGFEKYTFEVDGKAVGGDAAALLNKEFNSDEPDTDELMLPKKKVKPGDTWELDGKLVAKAFKDDLTVDAEKVKAAGKLLRVYDKDKAKYGEIEYTIELPVIGVPVDGKTTDTLPGSKLNLTLTVDACIDGTSSGGTSTFKADGKLMWKVDGTEYTVVSGSTLKTVAEPVKK
jgi:hypothetical protein